MAKLKLMGAIGLDWGEKLITLNFGNTSKNKRLKDILMEIKEVKQEKFSIYFDNDLSPKRGTIIIINGIDFNVIDGLESNISPNDEIIFIPTISGG